MEKYRLIKGCYTAYSFVLLIVFTLLISQPLAYSEAEHGKSAKNVQRFEIKEPFEIRNGRLIYNEHCAPCHGDTGKGDGNYYASGLKPKPRDFTSPGYTDRVSNEYLTKVIKNGTASVGKSPFCPPWGATLKEDEKIENIIAFLKTLYK